MRLLTLTIISLFVTVVYSLSGVHDLSIQKNVYMGECYAGHGAIYYAEIKCRNSGNSRIHLTEVGMELINIHTNAASLGTYGVYFFNYTQVGAPQEVVLLPADSFSFYVGLIAATFVDTLRNEVLGANFVTRFRLDCDSIVYSDTTKVTAKITKPDELFATNTIASLDLLHREDSLRYFRLYNTVCNASNSVVFIDSIVPKERSTVFRNGKVVSKIMNLDTSEPLFPVSIKPSENVYLSSRCYYNLTSKADSIIYTLHYHTSQGANDRKLENCVTTFVPHYSDCVKVLAPQYYEVEKLGDSVLLSVMQSIIVQNNSEHDYFLDNCTINGAWQQGELALIFAGEMSLPLQLKHGYSYTIPVVWHSRTPGLTYGSVSLSLRSGNKEEQLCQFIATKAPDKSLAVNPQDSVDDYQILHESGNTLLFNLSLSEMQCDVYDILGNKLSSDVLNTYCTIDLTTHRELAHTRILILALRTKNFIRFVKLQI